jgi:transcriptional regulator GlxA family with amidase domain
MTLAMSTVFEFANRVAGTPCYRIALVSDRGGAVPSSAGFAVQTTSFKRRSFDTVLVCGYSDLQPHPRGLLAFLKRASRTARRVGGPCTGAFALAEAGLLDGRRATTHWHHARAFRAAYPEVRLEEDRIFIIDGAMWTSAGMTACIDMALALVEKDLGVEVARSVAKKLVVFHRRAGGQSQYSALLELEPSSDRIQTALAWASENLAGDLSVEHLAEAAHLSPRQFSRAFREETGQSPAKAVEHLRVEAAKVLMEDGRHPMEVIARRTGFGDRERMRRAFLRAFGSPPQAIRRMVHAGTNG